jgi:hypothetical protein
MARMGSIAVAVSSFLHNREGWNQQQDGIEIYKYIYCVTVIDYE